MYENLRENDEKKSGLKVMMSSYEPAVTFAAYDWEINAKKWKNIVFSDSLNDTINSITFIK